MNRARVLDEQVNNGLRIEGNAAVLVLNNPPLNALSLKLRTSILAQLEKAESNPSVEFIVVTGAGRAFSAGADISEFSSTAMKEPFLPAVIDRLEQSKKLVVAAVNGICMGGGCEVALGCHLRVASPQAVFALPEIKLGLIPGAGGTQRLPRLVGAPSAIGVCCSGMNVRAAAAHKMGLADHVITEGDLVAGAIRIGNEHVKAKLPIRRLCNDTSKLGNWLTNKFLFRAARKQLSAKIPKGMVSPLKALDAIEAACSAASFKAGMEAEMRIFLECAKTPQAAAMQHFFFAERQALKIPGLPRDVKPAKINKVGVIGGGTMGGGIAMNFLNIGVPVIILETDEQRKKFCIDTIQKNYSISVARKRLSADKMAKRMSLLSVVVNDYNAFGDVDCVIEAVFESMALKKEIFAKLDAVCKPACMLCSNTSTLSIDEIASATKRPQNVIGAHFFSPANVMKLLEFVRGRDTDAQTIASSMAMGKLIKKAPVLVGNCFGFVSNRMILNGGYQVQAMLEEGCLPTDVDRVVTNFGFPIGPLMMQDLAGLDVGSKIRKETPAHFSPKRDVSAITETLVAQGRLGQKTGKGVYKYDKENPRKPIVDPDVNAIIFKVSKDKKINRRLISAQEILERYMYVMINEAAYILQDGFAIRPSDVDIVFIYGFGFPPYKGGPMKYADFVGIDNVVKAIKKYHIALGGDTFPPPCPLLINMAANGKTFASMNK